MRAASLAMNSIAVMTRNLPLPWQPALVVLARVGEEALQVLSHQTVKNCFGRAAWRVRRRERGHEWAAPRGSRATALGVGFRALARC